MRSLLSFRASRADRAVPDRDRRATWQLCSLLLGYPDEELVALLPRLRAAVADLRPSYGMPLQRFLDDSIDRSPFDLAASYVETFDQQRRCCLYLSYYLYGDTRKRGLALLRFRTAYRAAGQPVQLEELPDHLSVVLEFAATVDPVAGERLLLDHRAGVELLRLALADRGSPYAAVLDALSATLPTLDGSQQEIVARLAAEGPPVEEVGLEPFGPPELMEHAKGARR